MTVVEKSGVPSLSNQLPPQSCQVGSGLLAGTDLEAGDVCFVSTDGYVYRSHNLTDNQFARAHGVVAKDASEGMAVTLFRDVTFRYGSGLTPGTRLYVGANGALDDDPGEGGFLEPVGFVVDDERVYFHGSHY